jgi:alkylation response protein AidB-like acyl-CoA dehydrogenase
MFYTETEQRLARTGMRILGLYGGMFNDARYAPLKSRISHLYLRSLASTIAGGSAEIQRNVIATRGLGLPRA